MSTIPDVPDLTPEDALQAIRELRSRIPDFALLTPAEVRQLTPAAALDPAYVHAGINAIDSSTPLRDALVIEAQELRQAVDLDSRWGQVITELNALILGISGGMTIRRHRVGGKTLQAYQVGRQLARYKENADLLPHLAAMRRARVASRNRTSTTTPAAEPLPETPADTRPPRERIPS